jgi:hypothetical protein
VRLQDSQHKDRFNVTDIVKHARRLGTQPTLDPIDVCEHMNFNAGMAIECIWIACLKSDDPVSELRRARYHIDRELARLGAP